MASSSVNTKTSTYHKKALEEIKNSLYPFISTYDNKNLGKNHYKDIKYSEIHPPPLPPKTYKNKRQAQTINQEQNLSNFAFFYQKNYGQIEVNGDIFEKSKTIVINSVRSTRIQKPVLQKAVAPTVRHKNRDIHENNINKTDSQDFTKQNKIIYKSFFKPKKSQKAKKYTPQAFKFFIEQNIEKTLKSYNQRLYRRFELEKEMSKLNLNSYNKQEMRKMLKQKESNFIRFQRSKLNKSMFKKIHHLGTGAFGTVSLVLKLDTKRLYAMKVLRKSDVLRRHQIGHVIAERDVLAEANNNWVVKLYYSFQDHDNLYLIMDYIPGGDLMGLLIKFQVLQEPLARFYTAELVLAIESVHKLGYIHRDIKPDNILIDKDGHIKLTDFGLCTGLKLTHDKKYYDNSIKTKDTQNLAYSVVGTPNYIAPEILLQQGYTNLCDWWSLGAILYEMLVGKAPFSAPTITETQHKVMNWNKYLNIPKLSASSMDLIKSLLCSADTRLGTNIKDHNFFNDINFDDLRYQTAPYIPQIDYETDVSNFCADKIVEDKSGCKGVENSFHGFFGFTFRRFFDDSPRIVEKNDFIGRTFRQSVYV